MTERSSEQVDVCKVWSREVEAHYKKYRGDARDGVEQLVERGECVVSAGRGVESRFVVVISSERLLAIVRPLYVRELWASRGRFYCLIGVVFVGAFLLTFYYNVAETWSIACLEWDDRGECTLVTPRPCAMYTALCRLAASPQSGTRAT